MANVTPSTVSRSPLRAIVFGGAVVGILDASYAMIMSWARRRVSPARVWQGVASGLLGPPAFDGGLPTALLGLAIHFFIAGSVVTAYCLASRRLGFLARRPFLFGPAYGLGVYFFMNYVVIPLAFGRLPPFNAVTFAGGLAIHALGVGLPAALFARRAAGAQDPEPDAGQPPLSMAMGGPR
jgi:hypothetical protein